MFTEIRSGHYHDTGHLGQYLNTVAWAQALLILRKEHHYVHDDTALHGDEQKEEPEEEVFSVRNSDTALLRFAMKKLSRHHREALQLRNVDGLSYRDIGLCMGISEVTARTTYFKAKKHLKQIIEKILSERGTALKRRRGGLLFTGIVLSGISIDVFCP